MKAKYKKILASYAAVAAASAVAGACVGFAYGHATTPTAPENDAKAVSSVIYTITEKDPETGLVTDVIEVTEEPEPPTPLLNVESEPEEPEQEAAPEEPQLQSLGTFKLTAYCACEKCCGIWATTRPLDENGEPIVYTASQAIAKQGVTVAADTSVLPFGTEIVIDGHEYIVQDRGGAIKGNRIDVYFESHEEALQFGLQHKEVFVKGGAEK